MPASPEPLDPENLRRALLKRLPALTRFYGLMPWHIDRMTLREVNEYITQIEEATQDN